MPPPSPPLLSSLSSSQLLLLAGLAIFFFETSNCGGAPSLRTTAPAAAALAGAASPRKTIVVAHWKGDLNWTLAFARSGWRIVVHSKVPAAASMFLELAAAANLSDDAAAVEVLVEDENWGEEAVPYLRFLAAHRDAPPPLTVFVHGDPFAHSPFLADMLDSASADFAGGYFPLSGLHIDMNALALPPRPDESPEVALLRGALPEPSAPLPPPLPLPPLPLEERPYVALIRERINEECAARGVNGFIEPVVSISFYANAQFAVTAAAMRRRPRAFWEALLDVSLSLRSFTEDAAHIAPRKAAAFFFEALWHELFLQPRLLPWRETGAFCGDDDTAPLRRACCDAEQHAAFRAMLGTPRVARAAQKVHVWSWREGHKAP